MSAVRHLYVHVPFCAHKCGYCDFASVANAEDQIDDYLKALLHEMERVLGEPQAVETIFIGGGTPTHLSVSQLDVLLQGINRWLPLRDGGEFTVEANPNTLDGDKAKSLVRGGVNRVSLGAQSFEPETLRRLERTHDLIVEREGVFAEAIRAIRMAKILGYQVATNTTVYRETDPEEIEQMFAFLGTLGVDGHTISPGYEYDAAKRDMVQRLGLDPAEFFLTRDATREKFAKAVQWGAEFPILGTPGYLEFLAGDRDLTCSAWAIPTRNVRGWKGPCYLMTDAHYQSYRELLEKTDWNKLGYKDGKARDPRCENCMVHCGYEPSAVAATFESLRGLAATARRTLLGIS